MALSLELASASSSSPSSTLMELIAQGSGNPRAGGLGGNGGFRLLKGRGARITRDVGAEPESLSNPNPRVEPLLWPPMIGRGAKVEVAPESTTASAAGAARFAVGSPDDTSPRAAAPPAANASSAPAEEEDAMPPPPVSSPASALPLNSADGRRSSAGVAASRLIRSESIPKSTPDTISRCITSTPRADA